jgi:hypothetical protein
MGVRRGAPEEAETSLQFRADDGGIRPSRQHLFFEVQIKRSEQWSRSIE